jgi:hypothetical protein
VTCLLHYCVSHVIVPCDGPFLLSVRILSTLPSLVRLKLLSTSEGDVCKVLSHAGIGKETPKSTVKGFRALDVDSVREYLAEREDLAARVGPNGSQSSWQVSWRTLLLCTAH